MTERKKRNTAEHLYALIDALHGLFSEQGNDALKYYNTKADYGYLALLEQLGTLDQKIHDKAVEEAKMYGILV